MDEKPYEVSYDADSNVLAVSGSVDELEGPTFRSDLEKYSDAYSTDLTLDLGEVEFFPSLAVGVLVVALRTMRENGAELTVLAREGSIVARVLTVCRLDFTATPAS